MKSISHETILGQKGMNMVERIVLDMGYVWNQIHIESGIDAIIEIRDPATGETNNKIVQVQVKAVSRFSADGEDAFSFSCERAHIGYWLGGTARVILVVCRPDSNEIYWKDLQTYFSAPENTDRSTVRFSKKTDAFNTSCRSALLKAAKPEGGLALGPLPKPEKLLLNLLLLTGYPSEIMVTPTVSRERDGFFASLGQAGKPWLRELVWKEGVLYSFFDPVAEGIDELCADDPTEMPVTQWSTSTDPVTQRHFAELLSKAFEQSCYKRGVSLVRDTAVFYFIAPVDGSERRITTKSLINTTTREAMNKGYSAGRQENIKI